MDVVNEIQRVINTLGTLNIPSTYENMDRLLGCMQVLARVRDTLKEDKDGNTDTE